MLKTIASLLSTLLLISPIFAASNGDEVGAALDDARKYVQTGEYARALERHEWFHENALRIRPSYRGVRLSFALSYWKELGEKYPPAIASLKSIRDAGASAILAGSDSRDVFIDVVSINRTLGDDALSISLFKNLEVKNPQLAKKVFDRVEDVLLDHRENEVFSRYSGDLVAFLNKKIKLRQAVLKGASNGRNSGYDFLVANLNDRLTATTSRLVDIAKASGDQSTAATLLQKTSDVIAAK